MRPLFYRFVNLKTIALVSFLLSVAVVSNAQTTPAKAPPTTTESDDDMESDNTATADTSKAVACNKNDNKFIVFADLGGATIYSHSNGVTTTASGLTWAASGLLAHQFNTKSKTTRLHLAFGLEIRNFNGTLSTSDGLGSNAYNNYHYWYAGLPVLFEAVGVKHKIGSKTDIGWYAQGGMALGFKIHMLDVTSVQGDNSWNDVNDQYRTIMLHEYVSGGIAFKTKCNTFLLGPYVDYVASNISKQDGLTQNVLSYGVRFSALLFK